MRYERKYRIEVSDPLRIHHELMSNPCGFRQAYPDRRVNSIYYDDVDYNAYNANLIGIGHRTKYRVRWYGDSLSNIPNPILEKKIKKNLLGTKEYLKLPDFNLDQAAPELPQDFTYPANQLYPYIIVRYHRTYLESIDGHLRATIDRDLEYINLLNGKPTSATKKDTGIILEIKYEEDKTKEARLCTSMLPYRLTKNSKYVSAMQCYLH